MNFAEFKKTITSTFFDTAYVRQLLPDISSAYLAVQITRWKNAGKLQAMRRGLYVFADAEGSWPALANLIVEPSYLSGVWVLGFYGMIPEAVWEFTSACRTAPPKWAHIADAPWLNCISLSLR